MYLYHYPDIWYDYATWHAKNGSVDTAVKIFQRALKALPGNLLIIFVSFTQLGSSLFFNNVHFFFQLYVYSLILGI